MPPHEGILEGRESVAERTLAFRFSKPASFEFFAGQAVDVELTDPSRPEADVLKHTFSLTSAPRETELTIPTVERAPIVLFYSNPRPQDAAFLGELQTLAAKTERLILIATMTKIEGSS